MILQALVDYYEELAEKGEISRLGWGKVRTQYALEIDDCGKLLSVLPLEDTDEKGKPIHRLMELPAPVKRTVGIASNFLWDNGAYLLGVSGKGDQQRVKKCFEAAKTLHLSLLADVDNPFAKAVCAFFEAWEPEAAFENPLVAERKEALEAGGNLVFLHKWKFPSEVPALAKAWQKYYDGDEAEAAGKMRCLVTGEQVVPQETHPSIKNVKGAQSSGAALVSFNAPAFCSFGREQNLNAPVGKYGSFAYTTVLNHLLSDRKHVKLIGDATVVYWAEQGEVQYQDAFGCCMEGGGAEINTEDLEGVMKDLSQGRQTYWEGLPLNPENRFFVLGLAPNAARLSVRFFLQSSFGTYAKNLNSHYENLRIVRPEFDKFELLPLWKLLSETVNQNARDKKASSQMAGDTLRAILTGTRYPATLYQQTQLRIRAEREVTRGRAAIIKAYLIKNADDKYKEVATVKLNEDTVYLPYVLGRMFSVLEDIQEKSNLKDSMTKPIPKSESELLDSQKVEKHKINATIKDKYFTSACATPAVIFPILINLAGKHLRKLEEGKRIWYSKQLGELMALITEDYPTHLTLYDQGIFQLGYYHQTQKRYEGKKNKEGK